MALPDPEPGLVIRYSYLWHDEARRGQEEGTKDRPCAIVLAVKKAEGAPQVMVAPITHTKPRDSDTGIFLPLTVKRRLGLDELQSWIITDDVDMFSWPGPDLRPTGGDGNTTFAFGYLPELLTEELIISVQRNANSHGLAQSRRSSLASLGHFTFAYATGMNT